MPLGNSNKFGKNVYFFYFIGQIIVEVVNLCNNEAFRIRETEACPTAFFSIFTMKLFKYVVPSLVPYLRERAIHLL